MKVNRCAEGVRVRVLPAEADLLTTIIADLVRTLRPGGLDPSDPVYQRLFPAGYRDNPEAVEAFRSLTEESLRSERLERAELCLGELAQAAARGRKIDAMLDPEAGQRWIQVLNDMRLAIGTRLGITEDESSYDFDPNHAEAAPRAAYVYLTGVQDLLVQALMA